MAHTSLTSLFSDIADAIRAKTGGTAQIVADNFPDAIAAIVSGLEYKTGTYTPSSNTNRPTISLGTHSKCPAFVYMADTGSSVTTNCSLSFMYYDTYQITGAGFPYSSSAKRYGGVTVYSRASSDPTVYNKLMEYNSDNTTDSSAEYPRYWVTPSSFKPWSGNSSRNWRSGRTYKWIAVWLP